MNENEPVGAEEWEEIDAEEVERLLSVLSEFMEATASQNIRAILDHACGELAALVECEESDEQDDDFEALAA
jgi:hypothetical protein